MNSARFCGKAPSNGSTHRLDTYPLRVKPKAKGESPRVACAHDKLVPTAKLAPNPHNPNQHPPAQLALYAKIIRHQGWRKPITVTLPVG